MGWLHFLFLLYLDSKVSAINECNKCECCKTDLCQYQNGYEDACLNGCIDGYYGANCRHTCISNCLACQDASSCTKCRSRFYGEYCDMCPDNCTACSSKSNCNTCKDGFYSGKLQDFETNPDFSDCRYKCQRNCKSCTSYFNCTSCENGFYNGYQYSNSNYYYSDCSHPCRDSCKSCTSFNNCTKCQTGKYGPSCQNDCGLGCKNHQCEKSTGACNCVFGFQGDNCDQCVPGKYGTNCDYSCLPGCADDVCSKVGHCIHGCKDGFAVPDCNQCIGEKHGNNCDQNCLMNCANNKCKSNGSCFSCIDGYYGETCNKTCENNCKTCDIHSGLCLKCFDGFYGLSCDFVCPSYCKAGSSCEKAYGNCAECADGFYYSNNHCNNQCGEKCKSCETDWWQCIQCKDGRFGKKYYNSLQIHVYDCYSFCPENCYNITCDGESGHCNEGCVSGYWGVKCDNSCDLNCKDGTCDVNNGKCVSGCKEGYTGSHCKCPINCNCDANEICIDCKEGYYNTIKNCTCRKDFCADHSCTSCLNSTSYAFSAACCQCGSTCKYRKCQSENKCTDGCIDGYRRDDCSGLCKDVDQYCLKCTADFVLSTGKCLDCISGHYPHSTTNKCATCSEYCLDETCNSVNGTCQKGCKDGQWGDICENSCDMNCLRCNQLNGECSVCRNRKYLNDCSKDCSTNCNATNEFIMCAVEDGACLNGCDTPTKYGTHCEIKCSSSCLNNTCNWKTAYCLHGCKNGFHGDTCEKNCSENCVNDKCDKEKGTCVLGCRQGFESSSCTVVKTQESTDEDATTMTVWISVGASIFVLTIIAVIVMNILLKKRRRTEMRSSEDTNATNDNAAVTYSEILTGTRVIDQTDTVYPMPDKQRRHVPKSNSPKDIIEASTVYNRSYENVEFGNAAVYENVVIRHFQQPAAEEHAIDSGESAVEFEEEPNKIAVKTSKAVTHTNGLDPNEPDAADTYYNVTALKKSRIMLDKLANFVSKKTKGDFAEEFLQLPAGLIKPFTESQRRENILKNRYRGMYPYDDTRVILKDGLSDYINASYIDGYVKRRAYIASVGPTQKYMGDMSAFWRMVWQEQVGKIVMLTKLSEAGIPKCDQYWPNKDFTNPYADVKVTCHSEEIYANYTVRSFVAQKGSEKRPIVQVHFTAWPDKGIPDDVTSLIEFRQKVNSIKTKLDGPIIVHCSAGIGRTGTYIALDSVTIEGEVEGGVDIYACVRNLREQRVYMVQTAEQYRYLNHAVVHTLTFDSKAVEAADFSDYMSTLSDDHLGENFQKLQASVESRPNDEIVAVKINKALNNKNRKGADIPGDRHRPRLLLDRHIGSSDYINALYVNSFKSVNHFIVSQTPMPNTVDDFLTLIVQEKVTCVIDMESHVTKQDNVGTYFPADNQTLQKGTFTVKSEPGEKTDQYISKKLKISHKNSKEITVKHIQFTKWDDKTNLPADPEEFVQFIKDIELKYSDSENEGPILVHCLTGAEKSGLFCVISILLEKTQINQEISVVNTVRQIKYRRHMSVPDKEQYIFCHQCLHEYMCSFGTYSNICFKV